MANRDQPIIIKKVRKGGGAGHHGGAWKVAYADFVTAMMAFFLLMWLINTTSPEQKRGVADYFAPANVSQSTSGSGGILGGQALGTDGDKNEGTMSFIEQMAPKPPDVQDRDGQSSQVKGKADNASDADSDQETDAHLPAEKHAGQHEDHRADDGDGGVLAVEISARALLDGGGDFLHPRIASRQAEHRANGPQAIQQRQYAAGQD